MALAKVSRQYSASTEQALEESPHWWVTLALVHVISYAYGLKLQSHPTVKDFGARDSEAAKAVEMAMEGRKRTTLSSTTSQTDYMVYDPQAEMPSTTDRQPPKLGWCAALSSL